MAAFVGVGPRLASAGLSFTFTGTVPSNVQAGFQAAADRWSANFTNDVNINISIAFIPLGSGVIGGAGSETLEVSYTNFRNAITAPARVTSADDISSTAGLQSGSSFPLLMNFTTSNPNGSGSITPWTDNDGGSNNTNVELNRANARVLGLTAASDGNSDASIDFSSTLAFDFDPRNGITAGQIDFIGIATHEIGHALGFVSGVDDLDRSPTGFSQNFFRVKPMDFFRYSTTSAALPLVNGKRVTDFTADTRAKFFSVDGGATQITTFSTGASTGDGRQASHFKDNIGAGLMDPTASGGELLTMSENDRRVFDVLGFTRDNTWEWNFQPGGNFLDPRNWNANGIPSPSQDAVFELGATYAANVTVTPINILQFGGLVSNASVRDLINRRDTFTLAPNIATRTITVARNFIVGDTSGASASLTLTQGVLSTPTTMIGQNAGSTGTFTMNNGTWTNTGSVYVGGTAAGVGGIGALNAIAGRINVQTSAVVYPASSVSLTGSTRLTTPLLDVRGGQVSANANNFAVTTLGVSGGRVSVGTALTVGTPLNTGFGTINLSGTGTVAVSGSVTLFIGASVAQTGGLLTATSLQNVGTLRVSGGTANLGPVTGSGAVSVSLSGTVTVASIQQSGQLSITGNGRVNLADGSLTTPSDIGKFAVSDNAFLDLTDQAVVWHNGNVTTARDAVKSWWSDGARTGTGIGSSVASAAGFTTVAVFGNSAGGGAFYSNYGTLSLVATDVILMYTYLGDTNIDGVVDGADLANIIEGISVGATGWQNGDIDYNGVVTVADYNLALAAFNASLPALAAPSGAGTPGGAAVPEPTLMASGLALAPLLRRRRQVNP